MESTEMSVAKILDLAFIRFRAPDLGKMHRFLTDFGMADAVAEQSANCIYMRGNGPAPFIHATELGEPGFAAMGVWVRDMEDLKRLAAHDGLAVEPFDAPGGGFVVRLTDPDGFRIEAVAGHAPAAPLPGPALSEWNSGGDNRRIAGHRRIATGPSHVMRLGHCAFNVADIHASEAWYKERFGLLTSDEVRTPAGDVDGIFMRCDLGEQPADHHAIVVSALPQAGVCFMHCAFEVADIDDVMAGHDHLLRGGHTQHWGVGRHVLGSQIFDYWLDPWGHEHEHWTDGDQLRSSDPVRIATVEQLLSHHWGPPAPPPA
jgi:catechol 2,3-dioxygenase-like lactoylglutathione lyase family enzyme